MNHSIPLKETTCGYTQGRGVNIVLPIANASQAGFDKILSLHVPIPLEIKGSPFPSVDPPIETSSFTQATDFKR